MKTCQVKILTKQIKMYSAIVLITHTNLPDRCVSCQEVATKPSLLHSNENSLGLLQGRVERSPVCCGCPESAKHHAERKCRQGIRCMLTMTSGPRLSVQCIAQQASARDHTRPKLPKVQRWCWRSRQWWYRYRWVCFVEPGASEDTVATLGVQGFLPCHR